MENLQSCIEKCTINGSTFFYDVRFGSKIDEHKLHPFYMNCFVSTAKNISEIKRIIRIENNFYISVIAEKILHQTTVKFYPTDKTFVCRDYDPTKIIPAILESDCKEYLKSLDHPFYKPGYTANYLYTSDDLTHMYDRAIKDLSNPSRFCDFSFDSDSDPCFKSKPVKPLKKKGLFYSNELDWYNYIKSAEPIEPEMNINSWDDVYMSVVGEYSKESLTNLAMNNDEKSKMGSNMEDEELKRKKTEEFMQLRDLHKLMSEMTIEQPINLCNSIPKLDERVDNLT